MSDRRSFLAGLIAAAAGWMGWGKLAASPSQPHADLRRKVAELIAKEKGRAWIVFPRESSQSRLADCLRDWLEWRKSEIFPNFGWVCNCQYLMPLRCGWCREESRIRRAEELLGVPEADKVKIRWVSWEEALEEMALANAVSSVAGPHASASARSIL